MIFIDFGTRVYWFLHLRSLNFRRSGPQIRSFRKESIAKINFSQKSFFMNFGVDFCRLLVALGPVFLVFLRLEINLKTRFSIMAQNSSDNLVLTLKIVDNATGKTIYADSAAQYGVVRYAK